MSSLQTYQKLMAAKEGRAIKKTSLRHFHLSDDPLVVVGYHLAGDVGAPLALMWGTKSALTPACVVVPEPRDRECRFEALATFSSAFIEYLEQHSGYSCAPQIIVPNKATADWLFGVVGRFTRHLDRAGKNGEKAAPLSVSLAGKYLSFFHELFPGSSLVLSMTEVLSSHWETGQLPSEDLNLLTVLGWIAPTEGNNGAESAEEGEKLPPAGPISDPNWDADKLSRIVDKWHDPTFDLFRQSIKAELEQLVRDELIHGWVGCWQGYHLMKTLGEANSVGARWEKDCESWGNHKSSVDLGISRFRSIPTPVQSARKVRALERATKDFEADMAFDDPLVMARYVASGEALFAKVIDVDESRRVSVPGKRNRCLRPLVTLHLNIPFGRPVGTILYFSSCPAVECEVTDIDEEHVKVQVNKGAVSTKSLDRLPSVGSEIVLTSLTRSQYYSKADVEDIPWTHKEFEAVSR